MRRQICYNVHNKPSRERLGRTDIFERVWSDETSNNFTEQPLGRLLKTRGGPYQAISVKDGSETKVGEYETRSQGGHALRKAYYGEEIH